MYARNLFCLKKNKYMEDSGRIFYLLNQRRFFNMDYTTMSPKEVRALIAKGEITGPNE